MKSIYDYKIVDRSNNEIKMSDYRGNVLLIVNAATGCGFTPLIHFHESWSENCI